LGEITLLGHLASAVVSAGQEFLLQTLLLMNLTIFVIDIGTHGDRGPNDIHPPEWSAALSQPSSAPRNQMLYEASVIAAAALRAEELTGVPARVLISLSWIESRLGKHHIGDSRNRNGPSCGPTQIMSGVWLNPERPQVLQRQGFDARKYSCADLKDWNLAMEFAARILVETNRQCGSRSAEPASVRRAIFNTDLLAAYNGGCGRRTASHPQRYQKRILDLSARRTPNSRIRNALSRRR
jgi:hypothetical protein